MSDIHSGSVPSAPPAGWYPDPEMAQTLRYWDGRAWTEHRSPVTATAPAAAPIYAPAVKESSNVAGLGYAMAVLLPLVGFIIGITQINKREGPGIVVVSIVAFLFWAVVFSGL